MGEGVSTIDENAFKNCNGLTSLIIGTGVKSIGANAFENTSLKKTLWLTNTAPAGYTNAQGAVNFVSNEQFGSLSNKIVYPFLSSYFEVDGIRYVPVSPSERTCDAIGCLFDQSAENVVINESVKNKGIALKVRQIQQYACYENDFIKKADLVFEGDICNYSFRECKNLETLILRNQGCVGEEAFASCINLKTAAIDSKGEIGNGAFVGCSSLQEANVGNNVTSIGSKAFQNCSKLESFNVPDAVTLLDDYSFSGCSSLEKFEIGKHVKTIGQRTFENCTSIHSIIIPDSVKAINDYAFSGCTGLKNIIIADRDKELTLGSNEKNPLFENCPLDSVYIGGNITYSSESYKGYSPFYRNTTLRSVVVGDRETEISPNEFYGCTNLKIVKLGNSVATIGERAFSGCNNLISFSFGVNVKSIGAEAFSDCTALTKIVSHAVNPPTCGTQALDDINKWECTLSVPQSYTAAYQQANQWKDFFFINDDIVITNKYKIRYYVGDQLWAEDEVVYGSKLTLRDYTPEDTNRYSFAGWDGEKFETMPAYDIEYHAMLVDGLGSINADANVIEAIYDGAGRKLSKMQRGVNVLRMKDGTTRKVFR